MKTRALIGWITILCSVAALFALENDPLRLEFQRLGSRQLVLANTLPLCELNPAAASPWVQTNGLLVLSNSGNEVKESSLAVGAMNPYATCELDLREVQTGSDAPVEIALDVMSLGGATHVQVVANYGSQTNGLVLRLVKEGKVVREQILLKEPAPVAPCVLRAHFSGTGVAVFASHPGCTVQLGATTSEENFGDISDLRNVGVITRSTLNVLVRVPPGDRVVLGGARAFLSSGEGMANVRLITHKDGAPIMENNRLWFTFEAVGTDSHNGTQGVLSLDPSLMDPRFEGLILFDHGDGLLRNDRLSQLFYDEDVAEWRGWSGGHNFILARSMHDPRRGISVMKAVVARPVQGDHRQVYGLFDRATETWRLVTVGGQDGRLRMFESLEWGGPYRPIAGPVEKESTGFSLQNVGGRFYIFSASSEGPVAVYSYPDLRFLGDLKMELQPQMAGGAIRHRTVVIPLPSGFLYRYMVVTMGRPVDGLQFYGALGDVADAPYEYGGDLSVK